MTFVVKYIIILIMFLVRVVRGDHAHYMSAPDEIISWVKKDRVMKLWHALPSVVLAIVIVVKFLPLLSTSYSTQLAENGSMIPLSIIGFLVPLLIINGIIVEIILERTNSEYRKFKRLKAE